MPSFFSKNILALDLYMCSDTTRALLIKYLYLIMSFPCLNPKQRFVKNHYINIRCGSCENCAKQYSLEWSYRVMLEKSLYKDSEVHFITLTYNDTYLPPHGSLRKSDAQKLWKRIRKKFSCRYTICGEYGARYKRPHMHAILFGVPLDDLVYNRTINGIKYYTSKTFGQFWKYGYHLISSVTNKTALYCNKYMQKYNTLNKNDKGRLKHLEKPFFLSSRKPPIGRGAFNPNWLKDDKVYINGKYIKIPRSFENYIKSLGYDEELSAIKEKRLKNCEIPLDNFYEK